MNGEKKSLRKKLSAIRVEVVTESTPRGANIAAVIRLVLSVTGSVLIVKLMGAI